MDILHLGFTHCQQQRTLTVPSLLGSHVATANALTTYFSSSLGHSVALKET